MATIGALAFSSAAHAGLGASAAPSFPTIVTVGQTAVAASIQLSNQNSPDDTAAVNTVCNFGDGFPCPAGDPGITLIPSCSALGVFSSCAPAGADPGVFQISPTATGAPGTACGGMTFDVVLIDPTFGQFRFTPQGGAHVTLSGTGAVCRIGFEVAVVKVPTVDQNPIAAGAQTVQIVDNTQVSGALSASARGTSSGITVLANPTIATVASPSVVVGQPITDTATVTGRVNPIPGATVTFRLYGPTDPNCTATPIFTSTVLLAADGIATSAPYLTTGTGAHRWIASYGGDANNSAVAGVCGDSGETVTITKAQPAITTVTAPTVAARTPITDTAAVTGRVNPVPGATISFRLYGVNDPTCTAAPVFTSTVAIASNGTATSGPYTPSFAGTYKWIATYDGDANNAPVAGVCGDAGETATVTKAQPTIATVASPSTAVVGSLIADTAIVTGRIDPVPGAGTVTFNLYSPSDPTCTAPPFASVTVPIDADGRATSSAGATIAAPIVGTYHWVATYNGDANNNAVAGVCNDPNETVEVTPATPAITTVASAGVALNGSVHDTAALASLVNPAAGATVTFHLYGAGDPTCVDTPIFTSTVPVAADGTATSASFAPAASGTYNWIATYNGDVNNTAVSGKCGDQGETVTVSGPPISTPPLPATGANVNTTLTISSLVVAVGLALQRTSKRRRSPGHALGV